MFTEALFVNSPKLKTAQYLPKGKQIFKKIVAHSCNELLIGNKKDQNY